MRMSARVVASANGPAFWKSRLLRCCLSVSLAAPIGWEEKQQAGDSLVPQDPEHRYNLPEGLDYDYAGKGLIREQPATPFPANPLETLNQESAL